MAGLFAVTGALSWGLLGANSPLAVKAAELEPVVSAAKVQPLWTRHRTTKELMTSAKLVVVASVASIAEMTPLTARDVGAAPGAPELPRQRITLRTEQRLFGEVGATFDLVHILPPGRAEFEDEPRYRAGERYLLFLQAATDDGTWRIVGLDGRLPASERGFRGLLLNGPEKEIAAAGPNLRAALEEAVR